jgi:hypothetical protein
VFKSKKWFEYLLKGKNLEHDVSDAEQWHSDDRILVPCPFHLQLVEHQASPARAVTTIRLSLVGANINTIANSDALCTTELKDMPVILPISEV